MPTLNVYNLTFPQGLHVGGGGVESLEESLEYVPSDTLFAALLDAWVHLGQEGKEIIPVQGEPAFKVTSAFPFAGEVRFYPRPVDLNALFSRELLRAEGAGKRTKKIRYISEALLEKATGGEKLDEDLFPEDEYEEPTSGAALQGGVFWLMKEEAGRLPAGVKAPMGKLFLLHRRTIYATQTAARVTVDRVNSAASLFHSERVVFNRGCGLWFGVEENKSLSPGFSRLLAALGENGLGGERTAGYGGFKPIPAGTKTLANLAGRTYLLSRWHPAKDEAILLQKPTSAYKLEAISGWLRTPGNAPAQRRKRVWMVAEGSLIEGVPHGDAAEVSPEYEEDGHPGTFLRNVPHNIYRPGFAVAMEWKRRQE